MCFPNTLTEVDFDPQYTQLEGEEMKEIIERYYSKWVDEVASFQKARIKQTKGETSRCSLVYCLPKELRNKFYDRYMHLIGVHGGSQAPWL